MNAIPITASQYNSADYLTFLRFFFNYHPCFLCGKVHEFHNHGKIIRLIRDRESYENKPHFIFIAYCPDSEEAGNQYTKRILPPFLIPECNITLENCMTLFFEFSGKSIDYDRACQLLGTYSERTVRRHYARINMVLHEAISWIIAWLAAHPIVGMLPSGNPKQTLCEYYMEIYTTLLAAQNKLHGNTGRKPDTILFPAYVFTLKKTRNPSPLPFDLVYLIRFFFDTS